MIDSGLKACSPTITITRDGEFILENIQCHFSTLRYQRQLKSFLCLTCIVNTVFVDDLAMLAASSAAIVLI